jgi:polar amino acid transport system permease protein
MRTTVFVTLISYAMTCALGLGLALMAGSGSLILR